MAETMGLLPDSEPKTDKTGIETRAELIVRRELGRPPKAGGWKAKIYQAMLYGAARGIEDEAALQVERVAALSDDLHIARDAAEQSLMARLPKADAERRSSLRARIALIRAQRGDHLPEVRSATIAIERLKASK